MFLLVHIYALTFDTIENELLHNLEAYYLLYDIKHIPISITEDMSKQSFEQIKQSQPLLIDFYRSIADNVMGKMELLRPEQEYIIPTG